MLWRVDNRAWSTIVQPETSHSLPPHRYPSSNHLLPAFLASLSNMKRLKTATVFLKLLNSELCYRWKLGIKCNADKWWCLHPFTWRARFHWQRTKPQNFCSSASCSFRSKTFFESSLNDEPLIALSSFQSSLGHVFWMLEWPFARQPGFWDDC